MRWSLAPFTMLVALALPMSARGQSTPTSSSLEIRTAHETPGELQTVTRLRELVDRYDVSRWIYTRQIVIDETQIPHSHPVLTIRAEPDDGNLLATFLHEQFHWLEEARPDQRRAAIDEFRRIFPDVPVRGGEGGRDAGSTYLHLIVCDLELQAVSFLLGAEKARQLLGSTRHYRWIYRQVLENPIVREVNARHGFLIDSGG